MPANSSTQQSRLQLQLDGNGGYGPPSSTRDAAPPHSPSSPQPVAVPVPASAIDHGAGLPVAGSSRKQPFPNPSLSIDSGTGKTSIRSAVSSESPGSEQGVAVRSHQRLEEEEQEVPQEQHRPPSFFQRAVSLISGNTNTMVSSPRLPFYNAGDDGMASSTGVFPRGNGVGNGSSSVMVRSNTPTTPTMHRAGNDDLAAHPAISFTGPRGLFSPLLGGAGGGAPSPLGGLGISHSAFGNSAAGYLSPRLQSSSKFSSSSGGGTAQSGGISSPSLGSGKRPFYKEKGDDDYPALHIKGNGNGHTHQRTLSGSLMQRIGSTTPASAPAPGKASMFRIPRSILRLFSRRSRTFPILLLLLCFTLWAMGYGRRATLSDLHTIHETGAAVNDDAGLGGTSFSGNGRRTAQRTDHRQKALTYKEKDPSRMGRLLRVAVPGTGLQVGDLNPMNLNPLRWGSNSGRGGDSDSNLGRSGKSQSPLLFPGPASSDSGSPSSAGSARRYNVLSHDPAGPDALPGSVGSAAQRYASWEGGRPDGRMLIEQGKPHPIPMLMERAKQRWAALRARQSKTFAQAVTEYERRYGRKPPAGFDQWYAFAKHHNVKLIDEFNIIEDDFRMFRAFSGASFRARVEKLHNATDFAWDIKIRNGRAAAEGELKTHDRAKGVLNLVKRFQHALPDMHIVYNGHDIARQNTGWEERARLDGLVQRGEYDAFDPENTEFKPVEASVEPGWGMPTVCPPDSAARASGFDYGFADRELDGHQMSLIPAGKGVLGTVVDSFYKYMDVCDSPQYRHFHSSSSYVFPWHPTPTLPLFTAGVHSHFSDIHCIITEQFGMESRYDPTWEERPFQRLIFKGQSSGPFYDENSAWKSSHRARLHILSHAEEGYRNVTLTDTSSGLVRGSAAVPNYQLNPTFLDTGIVGPPVQCNKEDGTCDEMARVFNGFDARVSFEKGNLYKYVGDFDGNSWSGRFPRLMASNAAVVKATLYREFWTDWAVPWLHFIPVQVDYSDLWDVLAFFRGGPNGEGSHDALGKEIAIAGKEWAQKYFRWEDMEAFTFRQYLEYARLYADDREAASYQGEVEGYEPVWVAAE